jgi:hypothetical protein
MRRPDLNVVSRLRMRLAELGCRAGWITADELIVAEVSSQVPSANMW